MLFYFNFWSSLLCLVLQVPFYFYTRSLFFDEEPSSGNVIAISATIMVQQLVYGLLVHCAITGLGFNFVKAEIASTGSENLLTHLGEGLILVDEESF